MRGIPDSDPEYLAKQRVLKSKQEAIGILEDTIDELKEEILRFVREEPLGNLKLAALGDRLIDAEKELELLA